MIVWQVYSIQHYVIKFVSERHAGRGFLRVLCHDITEILLKVAYNTINQSSFYITQDTIFSPLTVWNFY
jgi:hypothetical protein